MEALVKPRMRGTLHQIAFFVSVPAGIALIVLANTGKARFAAVVFATGLAGVFGASAAYHRVAWSVPARKRMKRLDHSMIFVLIAGTYTPLCLLALSGAWSVVMLATVWAGAVTGIVMKQVNIDGLRRVSGFLYITLGWISIVTLPQLFHTMSVAAFTLVVAGGLLYTVGAIVFAVKRPDPNPAVFAGLCQSSAVLLLIIDVH